MIIETDILEYMLIAILSIITKEKEVHLVALYFQIFKTTKLNYNIYNKKFPLLQTIKI